MKIILTGSPGNIIKPLAEIQIKIRRLFAKLVIKQNFRSMKKLNIPEYYARYYTATDHPEIIDVENANFISILAKGSFHGRNILSADCPIKTGGPGGNRPFFKIPERVLNCLF